MNKKRLALLSGLSYALLAISGCTNDNVSPFTQGGGASATNLVYASNFSVGVDPVDPTVIEIDTTVTPNTTTYYGGVAVEITARAGDINNAFVTSGTIYFKTEYGLLSASSCNLDSTGTCSVTWYSILNFTDLTGAYNTITAYTYGEESFFDANGNGTFDDGETHYDLPEPFVDSDDTLSYTTGDKIIDLDSNGIHTVADTLYNGSSCTHSTLCSGVTQVPIFASISFGLTTTK